MEQTNAFELLGATPSDSIETLQELLDEKELLSDDIAAVQSAYADLTNPKKRLIHEITYFRAEDFAGFKKLVFHEDVESPSVKEVAQILVNMGLWFDSDNDELFDDINASREESGFVEIENDATIIKAVDDLQNDCLQVANNYLDNLKENSLVGVFNQIVKIDEYESFFVDELITHYELIISESLQKKETECRDSFESIEKSCNSFNNGSPLSASLKTQISVFADKLKSWDNYAQPLQVNMQRHGGQHEASEQLLRDLRNKVIDLCNKSQEVLENMLYCYNAMKQHNFFTALNIKQQINNKLPDSLGLVEGLISIINIFQSVFAELDMDSERLAKDKKDLSELKKSLSQLNESAQTEKRRQIQAQEAKEQASKNCRIAHGVFAIISLVIMIICFACGGIIGGTIFTVMTVAFFVCCAFYPHFTNKISKWIIIGGLILALIIATIVGVTTGYGEPSNSSSVSTNNSSSTKSYIITFNKDGGSGGTSSVSAKKGQSMPYATAPTKKGYTFGGYYTSRNGQGTKYYSDSMSSSHIWDKTANVTLYAYWIKDDNGITLTSSNFKTYFNFSSSCSVTRSSYNSYGTATYSFSISPKSTFRYFNNSDNPSSITVTIGLDISSISTSYGTPSKYKITITLYKSSGYSYSGTRTYSVGSYERYWIDGIYSVNGKIYE